MLRFFGSTQVNWSMPFLLNCSLPGTGKAFLICRSRTVKMSLLTALFFHRGKVREGENPESFCFWHWTDRGTKGRGVCPLNEQRRNIPNLLSVLVCMRRRECGHFSATEHNCQWMCYSYFSAFSPIGEKPFSSQLLAMHQVMKYR